MILFTILAIMAIIAAAVVVALVGVFGGATLVVFGDVIVCVLILCGICKLIFGKKNK